MRNQPQGVKRRARGTERPPREYDVIVDGETAGYAERLPDGRWRGYRDGAWPETFGKRGGFLAAAGWIAGQHRAAKATAEPVTAAEAAAVTEVAPPLTAVAADPFGDDPFADPLA